MNRKATTIGVVLFAALLVSSPAEAWVKGFRAKAADFLSRAFGKTPTHFSIRTYVEKYAKRLPLSKAIPRPYRSPKGWLDTRNMPSFSFNTSGLSGHGLDMVYAVTDAKRKQVLILWGYTESKGVAVVPFSKIWNRQPPVPTAKGLQFSSGKK